MLTPKRIRPGSYAIGHLMISRNRDGYWDVWDNSKGGDGIVWSKKDVLYSFDTYREARENALIELSK